MFFTFPTAFLSALAIKSRQFFVFNVDFVKNYVGVRMTKITLISTQGLKISSRSKSIAVFVRVKHLGKDCLFQTEKLSTTLFAFQFFCGQRFELNIEY